MYDKLKVIELTTAAELVRYSSESLGPVIEQLGGERGRWLSGYRVKIIDGICIEASEHRLKPLRRLKAGALPGMPDHR